MVITFITLFEIALLWKRVGKTFTSILEKVLRNMTSLAFGHLLQKISSMCTLFIRGSLPVPWGLPESNSTFPNINIFTNITWKFCALNFLLFKLPAKVFQQWIFTNLQYVKWRPQIQTIWLNFFENLQLLVTHHPT